MRAAEGDGIAARMAALGEEFPGYAFDVEWYPEGPMFTAKRKRWDPAGGLYSVTRRDLAELRRELAAGVGRPVTP